MSDYEIKNPKGCKESNMPDHSENYAFGTSDLTPQPNTANEGCSFFLLLRFFSFLIAIAIMSFPVYENAGFTTFIIAVLIALPFINYAFRGMTPPEKQKSHSSNVKTDTVTKDMADAAMIASMADDGDTTSDTLDSNAEDSCDDGCCDDGCCDDGCCDDGCCDDGCCDDGC